MNGNPVAFHGHGTANGIPAAASRISSYEQTHQVHDETNVTRLRRSHSNVRGRRCVREESRELDKKLRELDGKLALAQLTPHKTYATSWTRNARQLLSDSRLDFSRMSAFWP